MMDRPDRGPADSDAPSETADSTPSTPSGVKPRKAAAKPSKKKAGKKAAGKDASGTSARSAGKKSPGKASAKSAGKKPAGKAPKKSSGGRAPTDDEIRRRAYEIHQERGGGHGMDQDDWHRAERELRARKREKPRT